MKKVRGIIRCFAKKVRGINGRFVKKVRGMGRGRRENSGELGGICELFVVTLHLITIIGVSYTDD